jgi:hypothetical protein
MQVSVRSCLFTFREQIEQTVEQRHSAVVVERRDVDAVDGVCESQLGARQLAQTEKVRTLVRAQHRRQLTAHGIESRLVARRGANRTRVRDARSIAANAFVAPVTNRAGHRVRVIEINSSIVPTVLLCDALTVQFEMKKINLCSNL